MARTKVTVTIDQNKLVKELSKGSNNKVTSKLVETEVSKKVKDSKEKMLAEFSNHPVTQEIDSGPDASNSSNTLGGYGNLYSFIGFSRGDQPTANIKKELSKRVYTKTRKGAKAGSYRVETNTPTQVQLEEMGQIPWASGLSWVRGIEKGISGLGQYFYKRRPSRVSRSGSAVQTKNNSGRRFSSTNYLSNIYRRFRDRIK